MHKIKQKLKKVVVSLSKKSPFFRKIVRTINRSLKALYYDFYFLRYKVDDKVVLFEAFGGRNYTCSPKALYEKMITMEEFQDYTFVWAFQNIEKHEVAPFKNLVLVTSKKKDYYKYCAKAKYWIVNSIMPEYVRKKKKQIYVQCWHGTPLKRLRYDIKVSGSVLNSIDEIKKRNDIDAKRFDYFISPSRYASKVFTSAFNLKALHKKNIIIEEGYPRNDFLFHKSPKEIEDIKKKLGIPKGKKAIFYLPTFRDDQHASGVGYTYQLAIDFDHLRKTIGQDYVILFSPHYFVSNQIDLAKYKGFIIDVAHYDEINELYLASDIIMTDYSSVFFDYANLRRPMIFYMYDYQNYKSNLRDFYISLDELPGPITKNQKELEKAILNIDKEFKKYTKKYEQFNKKFNYLDDGEASLRVIKIIFKDVVK